MTSLDQLKDSYTHVIVGGGIAADAAARAALKADPDAEVLVLNASQHPPVGRPALSKKLWMEPTTPVADVLLGTERSGATVVNGVTVTDVDADQHTVTVDGQTSVGYHRLLLATGSRPRTVDGFPARGEAGSERVHTLRSVEDYVGLRAAVEKGTRVAVIGGGFIASELAAGLANVGAEVSVHFSGDKLLGHMLPDSLADHVAQVFGGKGITLSGGFTAESVDVSDPQSPVVVGADGSRVTADVVVLALGAEPVLEPAEAAGVELAEGGVRVDAHLATSVVDVWAAGDIAAFPDELLGRRRVEHVANGDGSGEVAGANMAGEDETYTETPMFYSDLFDDGYEAVGVLSTDLETREFFSDDGSAAVVYYLDGGKVVGVLLWNTWDKVPAARQVIADSAAGKLGPADLAERITPGA